MKGITTMLTTLAQWRKALASGIGTLLTILTFTGNLPFIPSTWVTTIGVVVGILTPIATWLVPNKTKG